MQLLRLRQGGQIGKRLTCLNQVLPRRVDIGLGRLGSRLSTGRGLLATGRWLRGLRWRLARG